MGFGPNYSIADVPGTPEHEIRELRATIARLEAACLSAIARIDEKDAAQARRNLVQVLRQQEGE